MHMWAQDVYGKSLPSAQFGKKISGWGGEQLQHSVFLVFGGEGGFFGEE